MIDRNLGATSVTPKDQNAYGAWYQWGRKDPFPRPLDIVRSSATTVDNKELTAFLKAYASGMISLPEGMLQEGNTENEETEGYEDEA